MDAFTFGGGQNTDSPSITTSGFDSLPCLKINAKKDEGQAWATYPVDFTKYKYFIVIVGGYSYYASPFEISCGNASITMSQQLQQKPCTFVVSEETAGITTGTIKIGCTRSNNGGVTTDIYKILGTNFDVSGLIF